MRYQKNDRVTLLIFQNLTVYILEDKVVYSDNSKTSFLITPGTYETDGLTIRKDVFPLLSVLGLHVAPDLDYIDSYISAAKEIFGAEDIKDLRLQPNKIQHGESK